jgi:ribosomal protein L39E
LPVGNIAANEIDIRIYNDNRKFDAGNIKSPLYQTLKQNRRIKAWIGVNTTSGKEFVPLGVFWSGDWNVPEQDVYAQTTGRDRLEMLRKSTYSNSQVQVAQTLYSLAILVLEDAGLTSEEYFVDTELQEYLVPYSYFENQSHREALRKIAEACLGQCYCDREGIVRIEGPSYLEIQITPVDTLTGDDYFSKDNPVKWSQVANYIEVETQPLKPDVFQEVYTSNEAVSIATGETKIVTAYYNETPCINAVASITGSASITSATYYAWGANIKVYSATAGTFEVTINAQPLKILNKDKAVRQDADSIIDMGVIKYTFPTNPLVQTTAVAEVIAENLLIYYKNPRRDVEIDWRGNPAMLLGDRISVTNKLEQNDYYVVKQELEFNGALRAKLSGRKV